MIFRPSTKRRYLRQHIGICFVTHIYNFTVFFCIFVRRTIDLNSCSTLNISRRPYNDAYEITVMEDEEDIIYKKIEGLL
jgi:hypothetical protein